MAYTPATSYSYTPMSLNQIQGGNSGNSFATQGMDFARWAAQQGIDLANLARVDRNTQLEVQNQFQRDLLKQQQEQQKFQNAAAIRAENEALYQSRIGKFRGAGAGSAAAVSPEVQMYQAQLTEQERRRKAVNDYNTAHGWSMWNRPATNANFVYGNK